MIAPATYLMDGPLSALAAARERKIEAMAGELLTARADRHRGDAIAVLLQTHPTIDVFLLVDEAIYLAQQMLIAAEMSAP